MTVLERPSVQFETGDDLRRLASARRDRARFVRVPEKTFLAINGSEAPGGEGFIAAIGALYGSAYRVLFTLKARGVASHVGMLEGLYWLTPEELIEDAPTDAHQGDGQLRWRLLIAVPDAATEDEVDEAIRAAKPEAMRDRLYVDRWAGGDCAQILHVGSYATEGPSLRRLREAMTEHGLRPRGPHHEIYLNDPRRVGEKRAKTVLRQGVSPA